MKKFSSFKRYLWGIPLFNLLIILLWSGMKLMEQQGSSYRTAASIIYIGLTALAAGGFVLTGFLLGMGFVGRKNETKWSAILLGTAFTFLIFEPVYLLFYFLVQEDHSQILFHTLAITVEQSVGFFVGCFIRKLSISLR